MAADECEWDFYIKKNNSIMRVFIYVLETFLLQSLCQCKHKYKLILGMCFL